MEIRDIAAALGISVNHVSVSLHRAPGQRDVLWANVSGVPLLFDIDHAGVQMSLRFHFDVALPAEVFSLERPTGYALLGPEGAGA